jgi:predicted XRE-type DNA-binding protein
MKSTEFRIGNYLGYAVREDGIIFSKRNSLPMNFTINDKGYPCVSLSDNGKPTFKSVHRIMATLFIPNPENKPCVNHKDRDRSNYNLNNLEWCTHSENVIHSVKNGGRKNWTRDNTGENNSNSKLNWLIVCAIRDLYSTGKYSQNELSKIFNISQSRISKITKKQIWKLAN